MLILMLKKEKGMEKKVGNNILRTMRICKSNVPDQKH
jgi:hypothetical protein